MMLVLVSNVLIIGPKFYSLFAKCLKMDKEKCFFILLIAYETLKR
jgi:hypothetical protein